MEQIIKIGNFIVESFIHIWPFLLITIPLAVIVQVSGAAKYINVALGKKPVVSILLATLVGALSPFCSCSVIPVITTLLIGGVPLAPVMSFWIASPSMDPEIFFLSTASLGWNLAGWRLAATFCISLSAGFLTHFLFIRGALGSEILRDSNNAPELLKPLKVLLKQSFSSLKRLTGREKTTDKKTVQLLITAGTSKSSETYCCVNVEKEQNSPDTAEITECECIDKNINTSPSLQKKIFTETWKAVVMVTKFMTLAFLINALINFYVPQEMVAGLLGGSGSSSVLVAALAGVPVYTSNITALPLISGLLKLGMNEGAALAFLISGPMTTLPAMSAVWGIVRLRVFLLYLSFSIVGSILAGLLFNFLN